MRPVVLDSWKFLQKERGFQLFAFAILENHLHLIASAPDISGVMQSFKSYTARQIVDLLEARHSQTLLRQLAPCERNGASHRLCFANAHRSRWLAPVRSRQGGPDVCLERLGDAGTRGLFAPSHVTLAPAWGGAALADK